MDKRKLFRRISSTCEKRGQEDSSDSESYEEMRMNSGGKKNGKILIEQKIKKNKQQQSVSSKNRFFNEIIDKIKNNSQIEQD